MNAKTNPFNRTTYAQLRAGLKKTRRMQAIGWLAAFTIAPILIITSPWLGWKPLVAALLLVIIGLALMVLFNETGKRLTEELDRRDNHAAHPSRPCTEHRWIEVSRWGNPQRRWRRCSECGEAVEDAP